MSLKGYINNLESFGAVDGPGVRFVVFLQGCKMRCQYCHNPETWPICTSEDDAVKHGVHVMTPQQVLEKALRYREYWGDQGGITVSGGEPLLQIDFVAELFELAHKHNINTCIDTAGQPYTNSPNFLEKFDKLCGSTDLFIVDIKHIDEQEHKKLTGQSNKNILDMIRYLDNNNKKMWARHVLVPGVTDDQQNLKQIAEFLNKLNNVEKREILPYHTLGVPQWQRLGLTYQLSSTQPPTPEQIKKATDIICSMLS